MTPNDERLAVVGAGPVGALLLAALTHATPHTAWVVRDPERRAALGAAGLTLTGQRQGLVRAALLAADIGELAHWQPDVVFLATKATGLDATFAELRPLMRPGVLLVLAQNGLDNERRAADVFGADAVLRLVVNFGGLPAGLTGVDLTYFGPPNYLGGLDPGLAPGAARVAAALTAGGLHTEYSADFRRLNWKKVALNAAINGIAALTGQTVAEIVACGATRAYLARFVREVAAVAAADGCPLGEDTVQDVLQQLQRIGPHKPSMLLDLEAGRPTEIAVLNGRISALGRRHGVATPHNDTVTLLVRGVEAKRGICRGGACTADETIAECRDCPWR